MTIYTDGPRLEAVDKPVSDYLALNAAADQRQIIMVIAVVLSFALITVVLAYGRRVWGKLSADYSARKGAVPDSDTSRNSVRRS
ncbi:MAG: hypothetical protein V4673_14350 [Pseudomonadota bacterium]